MTKEYFVYILASRKNGTLYVGVTDDLLKRIYQHKQDLVPGFTKKYGVHNLVYYEKHNDIYSAIEREKRIKKWHRQWKINLINTQNPDWNDLYDSLHIAPALQAQGAAEKMDSATSAE